MLATRAPGGGRAPAACGRSAKTAERAEVQVQLVDAQSETPRELGDRLLQPHQRQPDRLRLLGAQRARVHAANRLLLEQPSQELDQREDELGDGALNVLGTRVPARWRQLG